MNWHRINFGKNKKVQNKTLPQIMFIDPDWFFYQNEIKDGYLRKQYGDEADYIYIRARKIKPQEGCYVKHFIYPDSTSYGFSFIAIQEAETKYKNYIETGYFDKDYHKFDSDRFTILKTIDLYFPKQQKQYDKQANKFFIKDLKDYVFGGSKVTEKRAIEFFENNSNFIL